MLIKLGKREVFIIGAKGIPAKYGGFESFVEQLTRRQQSDNIHYNIACRKDLSECKKKFFNHNGAMCFNVGVPNIGPGKAILYDIKAFNMALSIIKKKRISNPIVYVLACRIGPFMPALKKKLELQNGILFVNPDGHEWMRQKWSKPVQQYWKQSEKLMVKYADLLICDSESIEKYIQKDYKDYSPKTCYISYGSDILGSKLTIKSLEVKSWFEKNQIKPQQYYLIVGRFVPENNYETMISEFMKSTTKKDLVIITNVSHNKFYEKLLKKTRFNRDSRIKFVGTVYDGELLRFIRENAYGYIHGHEVGGTNPSLLEALGSTELNLLLNVGFNREVGADSALYWKKDSGSLRELINRADLLDSDQRKRFGKSAKNRIVSAFHWNDIVYEYEKVFKVGMYS